MLNIIIRFIPGSHCKTSLSRKILHKRYLIITTAVVMLALVPSVTLAANKPNTVKKSALAISGIHASSTTPFADILWTTNKQSDSKVTYWRYATSSTSTLAVTILTATSSNWLNRMP